MSIEANQRLHLPDVHLSKEEMKTYFDKTVGTGRVFMLGITSSYGNQIRCYYNASGWKACF